MVRAVASRKPRPRNEDLTIATITPLSDNPLHFLAVKEILSEFLEVHRTPIKEI